MEPIMIFSIASLRLDLLNLAYLAAAVLFIFGLKRLGSVKTARQGNLISAGGMLLAVAVTFFYMTGGELVSLLWIGAAMAIGAIAGLVLALRVPMTGMPQMVALLNGFGGIASLLVACADYAHARVHVAPGDVRLPGVPAEKVLAAAEAGGGIHVFSTWDALLATGLAVLIGGVTFTGSLVAFGKLQGLAVTPSRPVQFPGQKLLIGGLLVAGLILAGLLVLEPTAGLYLVLLALLALALGILLVIGIGGADMPVVVSLLNSYSGLAAAMAGFALGNQALIITGSLVGAAGLILTNLMCKAMNRSLANVLFGGVGGGGGGAKGGSGEGGPQGEARELTPEDVAIQLDAASQLIIVPGYGMAVAQAQHAVAELAELLTGRGVTVKYAIHPVAGRMPGHMNVLLAEANVPYDQLFDLETVNPEFEQTDVALVIGANDVTNPAARHAEDSPIYGMPILDVDKARSVIVIKRSLSPGYAGIQNELYFRDNCAMLFGDGKAMAQALVNELEAL